MAQTTPQHTILVGFDASDEACDALALAELLGETLGSKLTLARVCSPEDPSAEGLAAEALRDAPLTRFAPADVERAAVSATSAARGLCDLAVSRGFDLLVVGSTDRGALGRVLPGSVGRRLLKRVPCPLAIAPRDYRHRASALETIVAGFDGTDDSSGAVRAAVELAGASGALLRVISIVDADVLPHLGPGGAGVIELVGAEQRERLSELLRHLPAQVRTEAHVTCAPVVPELIRQAREADLLVLGSRRYGPVKSALLGDVPSELVDSAPCPLIVVPPGAAKRR